MSDGIFRVSPNSRNCREIVRVMERIHSHEMDLGYAEVATPQSAGDTVDGESDGCAKLPTLENDLARLESTPINDLASTLKVTLCCCFLIGN